MNLKKLIILLVVLTGCPTISRAATNYVGTGESYTTIQAAINASTAGDTIIIRDGTYSGNITTLPVGTDWATGRVIIKAEHDGLVNVTGDFLITYTGDQFCQVEGINFNNEAIYKACWAGQTKFFRCSFVGGRQCTTSCSGDMVISLGHDQLYEDCYFYGVGGRYTVAAFSADGLNAYNLVLRRCVIRRDGGYVGDSSNNNPEAPMVLYGATEIALQNCIIIDSLSTNEDNEYVGSLYLTSHSGYPVMDNIDITGCIFINNTRVGVLCDTAVSGTEVNITDSVLVGFSAQALDTVSIAQGIVNYPTQSTTSTFNISNITITDFDTVTSNAVWGNGSVFNVTNTVAWDFVTGGSTPASNTYSDYYNPASFTGGSIININPETNGLLYPVRVESESTLSTSGSSGGIMGATILKRIGVSGTMYGDTGYDTVTGDDLWPWSYEDRIKADMSGVSTRGFCADTISVDGVSPLTLTRYVWEYLGNEIPADIYGETPAYDAPIVVILTESRSTTAETITIIGTLTTDSELTGSMVDVNGVTATADDGTFDEEVEAWTALGVTLSIGANTITATGTDSESETDTDTVSITRTSPVKTTKINGTAVLKGAVIHQ